MGGTSVQETRRHETASIKAKERLQHALYRVGSFTVVIVLWQLLYSSGIVARHLLPSPLQVFQTFLGLAGGSLVDHVWASTQRVLLGVIIGVAAAVPVGFLLGWYKSVRLFLDSLINFMRALPPIALIPLVVVYFGIGESARLIVLVYASFFAAVVVLYEGIRGIEHIYVRAAQALGATEWEIFWRVTLPAAVPHILTAFRVALGVAWATLVAAELVAAQKGLGAMIQNASNFFQIPTIFVGIILIGFVALLMDTAIRSTMNYFVSWRETKGD